MKKTVLILLLGISLQLAGKPSQRWLDSKFSMFIHFGLYSELGGVWNDEPVRWGYSEQIQSFAGIFSDWYGATAEKFNPSAWNADEVVSLAKDAGMKTIVMTAKHHDGFCMYQSKYTDFNIVAATAFGKDILKELSEACRRQNIGLGIYFSLIDWHFPEAYPISSHNVDRITDAHHRYNLKQVEELLTLYGEVTELWFDMGALLPEQSKELYLLVKSIQPNCMISGRLGNDYSDFCVMPDNNLPDYSLGIPWQTAASFFNETWGYRSWQDRGDPAEKLKEKILDLIKVVASGGNYLLNIGPMGDGAVVPFERQVLLDIGKWLKVHGEAIYACNGNPFSDDFYDGELSYRDNNIYLFLSEAPKDNIIKLSHWAGADIEEVSLLSSREALNYEKGKAGELLLKLHDISYQTPQVVRIKCKEKIDPLKDRISVSSPLTPYNAQMVYGYSTPDYYSSFKSIIGYDWQMKWGKASTPKIEYTKEEEGKTVILGVGEEAYDVRLISGELVKKTMNNKRVKWGALYSKPARGLFGSLKEEHHESIDVADSLNAWKREESFVYGRCIERKLSQRRGMLFLQEIYSDRDQEIAIELGANNAIYLLVNGKMVFSQCPSETYFYKKQLRVQLRKGNNQLIIKSYNKFKQPMIFSLKPLDTFDTYQLSLPSLQLSRNKRVGVQKVSLRLAEAETEAMPLQAPNIKLIF